MSRRIEVVEVGPRDGMLRYHTAPLGTTTPTPGASRA